MAWFIKKAEPVEAYSFEWFEDYAKSNCKNGSRNFIFRNFQVTYENKDCYLITTSVQILYFTRNDVLTINSDGRFRIVKKYFFVERYFQI
jgi:hypothetical protein